MDGLIEGVYSFSMMNCHATLTAPLSLFRLLLYLCSTPASYRSISLDGATQLAWLVKKALGACRLRSEKFFVNSFQHGEAWQKHGSFYSLLSVNQCQL